MSTEIGSSSDDDSSVDIESKVLIGGDVDDDEADVRRPDHPSAGGGRAPWYPVGFQNPWGANYCYLNATLQMLFRCEPLMAALSTAVDFNSLRAWRDDDARSAMRFSEEKQQRIAETKLRLEQEEDEAVQAALVASRGSGRRSTRTEALDVDAADGTKPADAIDVDSENVAGDDAKDAADAAAIVSVDDDLDTIATAADPDEEAAGAAGAKQGGQLAPAHRHNIGAKSEMPREGPASPERRTIEVELVVRGRRRTAVIELSEWASHYQPRRWLLIDSLMLLYSDYRHLQELHRKNVSRTDAQYRDATAGVTRSSNIFRKAVETRRVSFKRGQMNDASEFYEFLIEVLTKELRTKAAATSTVSRKNAAPGGGGVVGAKRKRATDAEDSSAVAEASSSATALDESVGFTLTRQRVCESEACPKRGVVFQENETMHLSRVFLHSLMELANGFSGMSDVELPPFGQLALSTIQNEESGLCAHCDRRLLIRTAPAAPPRDALFMHFVWAADPTKDSIQKLMTNALEEEFCCEEAIGISLSTSVDPSARSRGFTLARMDSIVLFRGQHYTAVLRVPSSASNAREWYHVNDAKLTHIGDTWADVVHLCATERWAPLIGFASLQHTRAEPPQKRKPLGPRAPPRRVEVKRPIAVPTGRSLPGPLRPAASTSIGVSVSGGGHPLLLDKYPHMLTTYVSTGISETERRLSQTLPQALNSTKHISMHAEKAQTVVEVTHCSTDDALRALNMSGGNVEGAINRIMNGTSNDDDHVPAQLVSRNNAPPQPKVAAVNSAAMQEQKLRRVHEANTTAAAMNPTFASSLRGKTFMLVSREDDAVARAALEARGAVVVETRLNRIPSVPHMHVVVERELFKEAVRLSLGGDDAKRASQFRQAQMLGDVLKRDCESPRFICATFIDFLLDDTRGDSGKVLSNLADLTLRAEKFEKTMSSDSKAIQQFLQGATFAMRLSRNVDFEEA